MALAVVEALGVEERATAAVAVVVTADTESSAQEAIMMAVVAR
jgi:hypothetical protein